MAIAPIVYQLNDPGFTIYHRAALGGLAATVRAWSKHGALAPFHFDKSRAGGRLTNPELESVEIEASNSEIRLNWSPDLPDRKALALMLSASFALTKDGMILMPGQGYGPGREDVLFAIHDRLTQTFLQHPKKRPGSGLGSVSIKVDDSDQPALFTYKKVARYSHQVAQGTSLLGERWEVEEGELPDSAELSQSLLPGAMGGARPLDSDPRHAFLLQFLMVACPVFLVRSRRREQKVQSCLVVPDVNDLDRFPMRLHRLGAEPIRRFSNTYLGRVVGGAEEAAMRFLIDLRAGDAAESLGVSSFLVVGMGRVPWDPRQQNRSALARVRADYGDMEFAIFEAAATHLGKTKVLTTKKGKPIAVPDSPVPELVAANLAHDRHWCAHFRDLVAEKRDFSAMLFRKEGLTKMRDAIQDKEDRLVIDRFQKGWQMTMAALGERARKEGGDFSRSVERERERIRNDLLRTRTHEQLTGWFLNFIARATRELGSKTFSESSETFRQFLFDPRNTDRLKNLLMFALVSYASDPTIADSQPQEEK